MDLVSTKVRKGLILLALFKFHKQFNLFENGRFKRRKNVAVWENSKKKALSTGFCGKLKNRQKITFFDFFIFSDKIVSLCEIYPRLVHILSLNLPQVFHMAKKWSEANKINHLERFSTISTGSITY